MLVLSRTIDEKIIIRSGTERIEVQVVAVRGQKVRLGVIASKNVLVDREEIANAKEGK